MASPGPLLDNGHAKTKFKKEMPDMKKNKKEGVKNQASIVEISEPELKEQIENSLFDRNYSVILYGDNNWSRLL